MIFVIDKSCKLREIKELDRTTQLVTGQTKVQVLNCLILKHAPLHSVACWKSQVDSMHF